MNAVPPDRDGKKESLKLPVSDHGLFHGISQSWSSGSTSVRPKKDGEGNSGLQLNDGRPHPKKKHASGPWLVGNQWINHQTFIS